MCFVGHEPKLSLALQAWLVVFIGLAAVHSIRCLEIYSDHWFSLVTLPAVLFVVKQKADEG